MWKGFENLIGGRIGTSKVDEIMYLQVLDCSHTVAVLNKDIRDMFEERVCILYEKLI